MMPSRWFEYGTLGDHPPCSCRVIAPYGRMVNDLLPSADRQQLRAFIPRLIGNVDPSAELARAEYLAWQAVRVFAPLALDAAGLFDHAAAMRAQADLQAAAARAEAAAEAAAREVRWAVEAARTAALAVKMAWAAAAAAAAAAATSATRAAEATPVVTPVYAAMIAALDGVLRIGRQAEPIAPARVAEAIRTFAMARATAESNA